MPQKYKTEYLGGGMSVFCSADHRFGTDAVLLHHFALCGRPSPHNIMDLGCGCGIIPMLFARDTAAHITGLDIQKEAAELLCAAAEQCNVSDRVKSLCLDLKTLPDIKEYRKKFDLVTVNPPYKRQGSGLMSENEALNIARFELKCTFFDICKSAAAILIGGGRFCVCNRPSRLCDMITDMRANGIEPKRMQLVAQRRGERPMLVLLEGVLGGNADIDICPELILEDENGRLRMKSKL